MLCCVVRWWEARYVERYVFFYANVNLEHVNERHEREQQEMEMI